MNNRSKLSTIPLSLALACSLGLPSLAKAQEPAADPATSAPVIVVAPSPAPPPPPPAVVVATVPPPAPYVDPQLAHLRHRRNSGIAMTIGGYTMFGTSYLISALIGTISLDYARDVGGTGTYGRRMLIPLAGPFMAIPRADTATGGLFTAVIGVVQVGGFVLGTAGAIRLGRANRDLRLSATGDGLQLRF